jgi:regulator of protease activity HflC (stomatin/prohibitin superfamily)
VTEPYTAPADPEAVDEALVAAPSYVQLTQQRVRLRRAAEVFATPDDAGRYPIVVLVKQGGRFQVEVILVAAAVAAAAVLLPLGPILTVVGLVVAVALFFAGSARAVLTPVPEGTQAVLAERGRFLRVAGPGVQRVPPTVTVTHLVTTREIPFGSLVRAIPTADDVRVDIEVLFTFRIEDPGKFVYNTTAPDFDAVCLGSAQATVREIARSVKSDTILDMVGRESETVREALTSAMEHYGVRVTRVLVVRVDPPGDFLATREARRLAIIRTTQQEEQSGLDRRVQSDRDALARQEAQARFEREKEQAELAAAIRRRQIELEADTEALRLEKLQERLAAYPEAARWDWAGERLKVARKLAGNSRAMIQLGGSGDVADAIMARALMGAEETGSGGRTSELPGAPVPAAPPEVPPAGA